MKLPTEKQLNELYTNENECIEYLVSKGVFYNTLDCPSCHRPMKRLLQKRVFRCQTGSCARRQLSLKSHTFFFGSRLECIQILRLAHFWLSGATSQVAMRQTGHGSATVTAFYRHFRDLVTSSLTIEDQIIGGDGIDVEVDETKLGKRKYHRGHRVDGVWVVVGIERTQAARVFLVPVEKRDAETLTEIIALHVAPGSIVHTDCWRGYMNLTEQLALRHLKVNHSKEFKNFETGACTNRAEGLNNGLKMKIAIRNRVKKGISGHLGEYIWRKLNKDNLWDAFIGAIVDMHYDLE